ncbi:hypothetical protein [Intrasporangium sp.]|uniref:hypothetical protein n=1 Tax=Intrasporangium sp. TaxID=1925024 RepID=UPI003365A561
MSGGASALTRVVLGPRTGVSAGKGLAAPGREPVRTTDLRLARVTDPVAVITGV